MTDDGRVLVSTEGQFTDVLEVALPDDVARAVAPEPSPEPSASPAQPEQPAAEPVDRAQDESLRTVPLAWLLGALTAVLLATLLLARAVRRR